MRKVILIIDDERSIRHAFTQALEDEGYQVLTAENGETAQNLLKSEEPDVILLDMKLPDCRGLDILRQIRETHPASLVIMMTAFGDIELAVQAMQTGAYDFRTKPFDVNEMKNCIRKALENRQAQTELESYRSGERRRMQSDKMVGESSAILQVQDLIRKVGRSHSTTVLIQGPSGTGKELVARAIHTGSPRADRRFIEINCTAIPESLLESELFGYEKGSFTDAKKDHKGIFEQADGGTLFLDEIGDMPLTMQAKLLRVLQEKRFKRVGGSRDITVDVRVIASTNIDLGEAVRKNAFREDLFYRLKVITVQLPQLRERGRDILLIAGHYLQKFSREFKKPFRSITPGAARMLLAYDWPGNVRELRNVLERAVLLETAEALEADHLLLDGLNPADFSPESPDTHERLALVLPIAEIPADELDTSADALTLKINSLQIEDVEKALLRQALVQQKWNRNAVAKLVGINRTTLYSKIKKYGLEKESMA